MRICPQAESLASRIGISFKSLTNKRDSLRLVWSCSILHGFIGGPSLARTSTSCFVIPTSSNLDLFRTCRDFTPSLSRVAKRGGCRHLAAGVIPLDGSRVNIDRSANCLDLIFVPSLTSFASPLTALRQLCLLYLLTCPSPALAQWSTFGQLPTVSCLQDTQAVQFVSIEHRPR